MKAWWRTLDPTTRTILTVLAIAIVVAVIATLNYSAGR